MCIRDRKKKTTTATSAAAGREALSCVKGEREMVQIKIVDWHGVAAWHWEVNDECCGICQMGFDAYCVDCKLPGDDCPPVWGKCNHAFHMHCILKWINSQAVNPHCPMCRRLWEFR
eukprot:TRINITY_DN403_c0_g4_i2.p2 TRINITY_DN403_c0_g4~~TRINITY_DN403_c0_g4_i2.p2  ORF type:complete len:116 (+),score=10.33 TRINITY_DN403_c0_g4_i2:47-394(+)